MDKTKLILLELVSYGIGKEVNPRFFISESFNWKELLTLSQSHGVAAIVLDGISRSYEEGVKVNIDFHTKMEWIGLVNQMELRYQQYANNLKQLDNFYKRHGFKMMILKGFGLSFNYPLPSHRPCGDIDIYLFGEQKKADKLIHDELGIDIDNRHHHHTVFNFQGETIENHYDFLNVHVRKSNKRIERLLKKLASAEITENVSNVNCVNSTDFIFPSVEFNAIYLLRHCAAHFASTKMNVRQILDWGLFMEKNHIMINWNEYLAYIQQEGMFRFYNLMGLFCMKYLGFDASIFYGLSPDKLFERFSNEILSPEFEGHENGSLKKSLSIKPRRWWHNRWKNRLCYPDSAWSDFIYGLWAKILKPNHFIQ